MKDKENADIKGNGYADIKGNEYEDQLVKYAAKKVKVKEELPEVVTLGDVKEAVRESGNEK